MNYKNKRKTVLNIHSKDWCWSWSSNTLATWCKDLTHWKDPDAGKDWGQEEKGTTGDEIVGWHHQLDGHDFEQAPGVSDGHRSLELQRVRHNWVDELNWTELNLYLFQIKVFSYYFWQCMCYMWETVTVTSELLKVIFRLKSYNGDLMALF